MEPTADLRDFYWKKIIPAPIKSGGKAKEIIDILSSYCWNTQPFASQINADTISFTHNIPVCYAVERELTVSTTITAVLNSVFGSLSSLNLSASKAIETVIGDTAKVSMDAMGTGAKSMMRRSFV